MSYGRRRWYGEQSNQVCPRRIQRFLEPCLLMLLHCNEVHGYELLDLLEPFGFDKNPVELSTVYRILRDLEGRGFVQSHWDAGNAGPARRLAGTCPKPPSPCRQAARCLTVLIWSVIAASFADWRAWGLLPTPDAHPSRGDGMSRRLGLSPGCERAPGSIKVPEALRPRVKGETTFVDGTVPGSFAAALP